MILGGLNNFSAKTATIFFSASFYKIKLQLYYNFLDIFIQIFFIGNDNK